MIKNQKTYIVPGVSVLFARVSKPGYQFQFLLIRFGKKIQNKTGLRRPVKFE